MFIEKSSAKELAVFIGISNKTIYSLKKKGILKVDKDSLYDTVTSIEDYFRYHFANSNSTHGESDRESVSESEEKAKYEYLQVQSKKLDRDLIRGDRHKNEQVKAFLSQNLSAFKSKLLSSTHKIAPMIVDETDLEAIQATLKEEWDFALAELKDYDRAYFTAYEIEDEGQGIEYDE